MRSAYSAVRFAPVLGSDPASVGQDTISVITFTDTAANRSFTAGFIAAASFWFLVTDGVPVVNEADIAFNPVELPHSTVDPTAFDIEGMCGHELVHLLSFEHSGVMASTAWAFTPTGQTAKRSLGLDDRAGLNLLYPFSDTASRTGALSGTVAKQFLISTVPVFGAHVVAVRQSDGAVVGEVSVTDGEWRIDGLPPDDYTVYAEPFDGPSETWMIDDGIYGLATFDTALETHFAGGNGTPTVYAVSAGGESGGIDIVVPSAAPVLNPRLVGLSPGPVVPFSSTDPVPLVQGGSLFFTITGPGIDLVPDDGVSVTGSGVTVSPNNVARGTDQGDPYMIVSIAAASDAAPGARSIFVDNGTHIAAITGSLDVMRTNPLPGLLRNDEVSSLSPLVPAPAGIFQPGDPSLEPLGPDNFPGNGEGTARETAGSDDDDDLYVPEVPSGYLDPDLEVLTDETRPLVFYQLTDPAAVLRLERTSSGRIRILY
jgi:hypothetical protein